MATYPLKRICVFCGSKTGGHSVYLEAARQLGRELVARGLGLVYGGGSVGLMGVLADTMLELGGCVTGVIPEGLATKELRHPDVADMHVVSSMHQRKARMAELSDAFVSLPGGFGTLEELFEVISWCQLGIYCKPIGILNVAGYFSPLIQFIDAAVDNGFIRPRHRQLIVVSEQPAALLDKLRAHAPPAPSRRWMGPAQT